MFIKQLSIFVENNAGSIQNIVDTLSENGINIRALSLADTTDFGILRLIVDDYQKARELLRENGIISKVTDVIAVYIDDRAGGLSTVLKSVSAEGIGIEYMYAFLGRTTGKALMVLRADDEPAAAKALEKAGIEIANSSDL
ncbi:MAG: hypothetical protein E7561_05865 [Ruminococcaceae bacterium]|nr:hypothetical protein [Oscillospiraceae bacterium]